MKQLNTTIKKQVFAIFIVWLMWVIGNLCANSLFFMGDNYNDVFERIGTVVYFITIAGAGILCSYHFSSKWGYSYKPIKTRKYKWLYTLLLFAFILVMGYFALEEQLTASFTFEYIFNQPIWWLVSPLILLLPTMIAYTLLWYCLLLRTFQSSFKDNLVGKILSIVLASFFYSIYHFTSVNEIFTLSAMLDEVIITFIISLVLGVYVMLTNNLIVLTIANLILNWFVFTPVSSFHTSGIELTISYTVIVVCIVIYYSVYRKKRATQ